MKEIWLINPYGPIEGESWRDYRYNSFGKLLSSEYKMVWWTSSFSHHFKKMRANGFKEINVSDNFSIRLIPSPSYSNNFSFKRFYRDIVFGINCLKYMKKYKKPSLIIENSNPLALGFPTFYYSKKYKVQYILDQMDVWPEFIIKNLSLIPKLFVSFISFPIILFRKFYYKNALKYISLSTNYYNFSNSVILKKQKSNSVIYNGIDYNEFDFLLNQNSTTKIMQKNESFIYFIFAGTLGNSYDIKTILDVSNLILKHNLNFKILIAGSGPYSSLVESVSKLNPHLIFLGSLKPKDLINVYSICDVGLAAYSGKSNVDMPDKFYDYVSAGLAIINSLNGEVKDIISEHKLGINYEAGNKESLFEAMKNLKDENLMRSFKLNSKKIAISFDMKEQVKKLKIILHEVFK